MRTASGDNIIQYIRLHKRLDQMLTAFSEKTGMRRATACVWILHRSVSELLERIPIEKLTPESLSDMEIGATYFISPGRGTDGSNLGKGMRITVERSFARKLDLISLMCGIPQGNLRCALIAEYFHTLGMI